MKIMSLFTLLLISAVCFAQKSELITIKRDNYRMQYPSSWNVDSSGKMGTEIIFYSPLKNAGDKFSENVNLLIQNLKGKNIDLKKYKEITEGQLKELGGESKLYQSAILKNNTMSYFRLDHQMKQENRTLRFTSVCYIKNEKAYLMTFTCDAAEYEQYKNAGENIMKSFVFTQ